MPLPVLPLELIERIVSFAYPEPPSGQVWLPMSPYIGRQRAGSVIARVCRVWRHIGTALAQRNLGIALTTVADIERFEAILVNPEPVRDVKRAFVYVSFGLPPMPSLPRNLGRFLILFPNLDTLVLCNASAFIPALFAPFTTAVSTTIKHLELREATPGWDPTDLLRLILPLLPQLQSLRLANPHIGPVASDRSHARPQVWPSPTHLELTTSEVAPPNTPFVLKTLAPYLNISAITHLDLVLFQPPTIEQLKNLIPPSLSKLGLKVRREDAQVYLSFLIPFLSLPSLATLVGFTIKVFVGDGASYPLVPSDFPSFLAVLPAGFRTCSLDYVIPTGGFDTYISHFLHSRLLAPFERWECRIPSPTQTNHLATETITIRKVVDGNGMVRWSLNA